MRMDVKQAEAFWNAAREQVQDRIARLRDSLTFDGALALPEADCSDIVVLDREVQLTVFRQSTLAMLPGQVLVTVQVSRHSMGGVTSAKVEQGLVFSRGIPPREATVQELADSGS